MRYYPWATEWKMSKSSGDPVETITEADAAGEIADLYAEIRSGLGVPVVNLIRRHLAVIPGGLSWAWHSVKPRARSQIISLGGICRDSNFIRRRRCMVSLRSPKSAF